MTEHPEELDDEFWPDQWGVKSRPTKEKETLRCAECKCTDIKQILWNDEICLYLCEDCDDHARMEQEEFERSEGIYDEEWP